MDSDEKDKQLKFDQEKLKLEEKKLRWEIGTKIGTTIVAATITSWLATY